MGRFPQVHPYQPTSFVSNQPGMPPTLFSLPSLAQKQYGTSCIFETNSDELASDFDVLSSFHTDLLGNESFLDTIPTTNSCTGTSKNTARDRHGSIFSQMTFGSDYFSLAPPFNLEAEEESDQEKINLRLTSRAVPASSVVFDYSQVACGNDYQVPVGYFGHDHGRPTSHQHHRKLRRRYHSVHHRQSIRKFYTLAALQQLLQDEGEDESEYLERLRIGNEKQKSENVSTDRKQIKTQESAFSQLRTQRHKDKIQGMAVLTKDKLIRAGLSVRRWKDRLTGSNNGEAVRRLSSFRVSTQPSCQLTSSHFHLAHENQVNSQEVLGQDEAIFQTRQPAKSFMVSSVLEKALDCKWTRSMAAGRSVSWRTLTPSLRQQSRRLSDRSLSILTTNDESVFFAEIDMDDCDFAATRPIAPSNVLLVSEMDDSSSCSSKHDAGNLVGLHWMNNRLRSTDDKDWFSYDDLSTCDDIDRTTLSLGTRVSAAPMYPANSASPQRYDDKETTKVSAAKSKGELRSRTSNYSATNNRSRWMNRSIVSFTSMKQKRDKLGGSHTGSEIKKSIRERESSSSLRGGLKMQSSLFNMSSLPFP